jgi:hypothetical protein
VDNQNKIYIKIGDGVYFCHRCGAKGSWNDFRRILEVAVTMTRTLMGRTVFTFDKVLTIRFRPRHWDWIEVLTHQVPQSLFPCHPLG